MTRLRQYFVAILLPLSAGVAHGSDWQYTGYSKVGDVETRQFFDAESVSRPAKDVVRVWVQSIRVRDFDRYYKVHEEVVFEKAARKIVSGYIPRFVLLRSVASAYDAKELNNAVAQMTADEIVANTREIQPVGKFYWEIDCAGKRNKLLDGIMLDDNGNPKANPGRRTGQYHFIAPDSNGEWLSLLTCQSK